MYVRISPGSAAARPSSLKAFDWTLVATLRLSASCRRNASPAKCPFMPELLSLALAPGPGQGFLYPVARAIRSQPLKQKPVLPHLSQQEGLQGGVLWQLGFQARVLDAPVARLPQQPRRAGPPRPGPHRPPGPSASTLPVPAGAPPAKARSLEISSSLKLAAAPKSFARAVHLSRSLAPGSASRVHGSSGVVAPARPVRQHRAPRPPILLLLLCAGVVLLGSLGVQSVHPASGGIQSVARARSARSDAQRGP